MFFPSYLISIDILVDSVGKKSTICYVTYKTNFFSTSLQKKLPYFRKQQKNCKRMVLFNLPFRSICRRSLMTNIFAFSRCFRKNQYLRELASLMWLNTLIGRI